MQKIKVPTTKEINFREKLHGKTIHDPYRWLEKDNDKEVSTWINQQNQHSQAFLNKIGLRKKIAKRTEKLLRVDTIGVPFPKNGLYFVSERKAKQDLPVLYVQKGLKGKRKVLIDQNTLSKGKTTILKSWRISTDGRFLAYALSEQGNDQDSLQVLNIKTGKKLKDFIPADLYPGMYIWDTNGKGFWYTRRADNTPPGEEKLHQKIYYHKLGDHFKNDTFVFGENISKDAHPSAEASLDGRYLLISVEDWSGKVSQNDLYIKDLHKPKSDFQTVVKNVDALFNTWMHRDQLFILTNHNAPNWKIMTIPLKSAEKGRKFWKEIIPEDKYAIQFARTVSDTLFVERLENVQSTLRTYDLKGKSETKIPLPPLGTLTGMTAEPEGNELFLGFTSFLIPFQIYRFNLKTQRLKLYKESKVNFDAKKFRAEQVWYRSKDGTKVPMSLLYKKGIRLNGKNPTLLYGYGGFNISETPRYSAIRVPFLELGGIYAIANIRGGGEFGEKWHKAGMQKNKQNVFDDFIAAAEWLIQNKYTDSDHLAAFGWSNGGLLTGAMITQRPELFKTIVVGAPVIDMLRFHKFHGGRHWISDYGDPDNPKMFSYLLKYCPYHNVKNNINYPAILIVTAEGDDRVHPLHAYKFTARLQKANKSANPILLRVERKAGHSGAASVSKAIEQYADIYGFIAWHLGLK